MFKTGVQFQALRTCFEGHCMLFCPFFFWPFYCMSFFDYLLVTSHSNDRDLQYTVHHIMCLIFYCQELLHSCNCMRHHSVKSNDKLKMQKKGHFIIYLSPPFFNLCHIVSYFWCCCYILSSIWSHICSVFFVLTIHLFSHSWLINGCVTKITRHILLDE
jgi:hypothetical protein